MYPIIYPANSEPTSNSDTIRGVEARREAIINNTPGHFIVHDNHSLNPATPILDKGQLPAQYSCAIQAAAKLHNSDATLITAIILMETGHCYAYWINPLQAYRLPMNVQYTHWPEISGDENYIKEAANNIEIGALILARIQKRLKKPGIAQIASVFHQTGTEVVNDYGAKTAYLYQRLQQLAPA